MKLFTNELHKIDEPTSFGNDFSFNYIVVSSSDGSSSICSGNGLNDDAKNMWSDIDGLTNTHFMQSIENSVHHEQLEHELISDVITNDLVIINGADLDQTDNEMIRCNFTKSNSQTIDSYFVDQQLEHESQQQHLPGANENVLVESNMTAAILNDSSNEVSQNELKQL